MNTPAVKVGLISNPLSQRNKKRRGKLNDIVSSHADILYEPLEEIAALAEILKKFSAREVGLIVLDGGDGTVQAALTELLNGNAYDTPPLLCVLPSGMTNLIAGDVSGKGTPEMGFSRVIERARNESFDQWIVERHVIRVQYAPDLSPIYGMFFGMGAVTRAIEQCRRVIHPLRIEGPGAVGLTLAGLLIRRSIRGNRDDTVFRGDNITLQFNDGKAIPIHNLLVLISTLKRLALGTRPFWGEGNGGLQVTSIAYPPTRFWRSLFPLLYGKERRNLDSEIYLSQRTNHLAITMNGPFTLDGEMFQPSPDIPVRLEAAGPVRFIRW